MASSSRRFWIAAICAPLWACGGGGGSGEVEVAQQVIDPDGGTLSISGGDLDGLRIEVPAQAVSVPTTFKVCQVTSPPALSALPPGFAAFNPMIRITTSPDVVAPVRVTFPLNGLPTGADKVMGAFFYDDPSAAWTLVLPRALSAEEATIQTGHFSYWRWGFSLVKEAPGDALARTIAEWLGQTLYQAFQAEIQQRYDQYVANLAFDTDDWSNCDKIAFAGHSIGAISDGVAADLHSMLTQSCGGCDISLNDFMVELTEFTQLKMRELLVTSLLDAMNTLTSVNFFVDLVMQTATAVAFDQLRRNLHCNYDCLFDDPPPGMIADLAVYYVTAVSLVILDIAYRYDHCPPM